MSRALMLVDPQTDFITGSLKVPGAVAVMEALASYIQANDGVWCAKFITCDAHPWDHCSFRQAGGLWPLHCVVNSPGAAIWPSVFFALHETSGTPHFFPKAIHKDKEEYSVFQNPEAVQAIKNLISEYAVTQIDLCGIAGDVCVLATLTDGIELFGKDFFNVHQQFSPSLDGGKLLQSFCERTWPCTR